MFGKREFIYWIILFETIFKDQKYRSYLIAGPKCVDLFLDRYLHVGYGQNGKLVINGMDFVKTGDPTY